MSTKSESNSVERVMDGRAWEEFCDALKAAGKVVIGEGSPEDAFDRAEGFRYLSRLARGGLESFLECADPLAPELRRIAHETVKMGADNPDNYYQSAPVRGDCEYKISGTRGTVHYLGFGSQAGNYGATGSLATTGYVEAADLELAPDGTFELIASARQQPGNWLPMSPESSSIIVRQTFLDRVNERRAELKIERIDGPHKARAVSPESVDRGLQAAAKFVGGCARLFHQWALSMKPHTNQLPPFDAAVAKAAGGDPNITYYHSYWELGPEEALVIETTPPECDYWNFQLNNHWMESLDYRYAPITVNKHSAVLRPDGSVRVVVAHRDPGVDNWIDTCGHARGTMCWRWIRADEKPTPQTRVVAFSELGPV